MKVAIGFFSKIKIFENTAFGHVTEVPRVINLEMAKILNKKGFNDVLPGQKFCRQCVTEYEKLTKPPENVNMTKIIKPES